MTTIPNIEDLSDDTLQLCVDELLRRYYEKANAAADQISLGGVGIGLKATGGIGRGLNVKWMVCLDGTTPTETYDPHGSDLADVFNEALRRRGYQNRASVRLIGKEPRPVAAE